MNRIELKFQELKQVKKKAFIVFITAGYPDLKTSKDLVVEFERQGVDIIELGVPFSDPLADGPIIQESSKAALEKNVQLPRILKLVAQLRRSVNIPICLMTYYNPVFCFGEEKFAKVACESGVDGIIIPDLPLEEAVSLRRLTHRYGLDLINFLSPTSSRERIKLAARLSRGFIYYVCLTGVTGVRRNLPKDIKEHLFLIKRYATQPVCVGFGISTHEQVRQISRFSDGVIIGSAVIREIKKNIGRKELVERIGAFVRRLRGV
ncbi:MAG: tryptophan synthase subunit alpha [Candidatus Omnitrophica bacterium]|nr:tryptophan synthase subunit alpha [Candidatus Omnitrophota bacterium]